MTDLHGTMALHFRWFYKRPRSNVQQFPSLWNWSLDGHGWVMAIIFIIIFIHKNISFDIYTNFLTRSTSTGPSFLSFVLSFYLNVIFLLPLLTPTSIYRLHCLRWSEVCQQICNSCIALRHLLNYCCLHWRFYELRRKRPFKVSCFFHSIFIAVNCSRERKSFLLFPPCYINI